MDFKMILNTIKSQYMKVLLITGGSQSLLISASEKAAAVFMNQGIECETVFVPAETKGCTGCGKCWKKRTCVFEDEVNQAVMCLKEAAGLMVVSPVFYGEPDRQTLNFMDRLTHCAADLMALKPAVFAAYARGSAAARAQARMNEYFAYADMIVISRKNGFVLKEENDILIPAERLAWLVKSLHEGGQRPQNDYVRELDYVR